MLLSLLNGRGEHHLLDVREIVYLQTDGNGNITIYSYDDEYKMISTVKQLSGLLQQSGLVRTDRGTLINPNYLETFDGILGIIRLRTAIGEVIVPVPRKTQKQIMAYLKSVIDAAFDHE
ncbi:LytTR family DNA-binding domain-containing protein [Cohnella terricola]|nr:LytTR family DNA-binding domain-containing protein [Cohnella terricola]